MPPLVFRIDIVVTTKNHLTCSTSNDHLLYRMEYILIFYSHSLNFECRFTRCPDCTLLGHGGFDSLDTNLNNSSISYFMEHDYYTKCIIT